MTHNMALCAIPLRHCHADCYSAPRIRAGSQRASLQASFTPTPPLRCLRSLVGASFPRPPPIPPMLVPPSIPKGGLRWHARQRLTLVRHRRTARFTFVLADSHGTSCPGLLCSALGRCRADRASHLATPAPAGYVLNRQTGFHVSLLSSLTAQTHAPRRFCASHSRGHRPLLWLSHASHRTLADSLLSANGGRLLSSCAGQLSPCPHVLRQPTA